MEASTHTPRRRTPRWTLVSGVALIAIGVLSFNAYASFTATASYNQAVSSGTMSIVLANEDGQIELTHSVSAGLDYAAVGPEHSYLRDQNRIEYVYATDDEALAGFRTLAETEGIIPALETAHAVAHVIKIAPSLSSDKLVVVNCSGRGDKDVSQAAAHFGF